LRRWRQNAMNEVCRCPELLERHDGLRF
jgi:hypothetical protein